MEEEDHPTTPDPQTPCVWCPGCRVNVPLDDVGLYVTFGPIAARITMDGSIDVGEDTFLDYTHLVCGAWVRMSDHATWDQELNDYVRGLEVWIEVQVDGSYLEAPPDVDYAPFSATVASDPATWSRTLLALRDARDEAVRLLTEKIGDESV